MAQTIKNPPAMRDTWVQSLGWEDPLEKGMATHSSIPAWRIPWTSLWGHKESDLAEPLSLYSVMQEYFINLRTQSVMTFFLFPLLPKNGPCA